MGSTLPTVDNLIALSELYGISLDELLRPTDLPAAPVPEPDPAPAALLAPPAPSLRRPDPKTIAIVILSFAVAIMFGLLGELILHPSKKDPTLTPLTDADLYSLGSVVAPIEPRSMVVPDLKKLCFDMTLSDFTVPAYTIVYFAVADIDSVVDISVDSSSALYFGISERMDKGGDPYREHQVLDGCGRAAIYPDSPGIYYLYFFNDSKDTATADAVILSEERSKAIKNSTTPRIHPILSSKQERLS